MKHKINPISDDEIVQVKLSMKQIRLLARINGAELDDAEYGNSPECKKTLESLDDLFFTYTHIEKSPEEEEADLKAWAKQAIADDEAHLKAMREKREQAA